MANKSDIDLESMSVQELTSLIAEAEVKRGEKLQEAKAALIEEIAAKAAGIGLSINDLFSLPKPTAPDGRKRRSDAGAPLLPKYRGPNGEEWTGRGRMPNWLVAQEAEGKKRDEFLIK